VGAGFLLAHDIVVTTSSCLKKLGKGAFQVEVSFKEGRLSFPGTPHLESRAGLALVKLSGNVLALKSLVPETTTQVAASDSWKVVPATVNLSTLTGQVVDPASTWMTLDAGDVIALQLSCDQAVADLIPYSGHPVYLTTSARSPVGGMLIEQERVDQLTESIYAVPVSEVAHFSSLDDEVLQSLQVPHNNEDYQSVDSSDPLMDTLEKRLIRVQTWAQEGIISRSEVPILRTIFYQHFGDPRVTGDKYAG